MKPGPKPWGEPAADPLYPERGLGSAHHNAKLNEIIVCDIMNDANAEKENGDYLFTYDEIAAAYGLAGRGAVTQIMTGYVWGHVNAADRQRWVAGFLKMGKQEKNTEEKPVEANLPCH